MTIRTMKSHTITTPFLYGLLVATVLSSSGYHTQNVTVNNVMQGGVMECQQCNGSGKVSDDGWILSGEKACPDCGGNGCKYMKIFVKMTTPKNRFETPKQKREGLSSMSIPLNVMSNAPITDIRAMLQDMLDVPPVHQLLFFEGKELEDGRTLSDYNIQKESTLQLMFPPGGVDGLPGSLPGQIHIKMSNGMTIGLDVEHNETANNVKARLQKLVGISPEQQKLLYRSKVLEDDRTLSHYNILKESTLHLSKKGSNRVRNSPKWNETFL